MSHSKHLHFIFQAALEYAREKRLKVKLTCTYLQHFVSKHPEYSDLVLEWLVRVCMCEGVHLEGDCMWGCVCPIQLPSGAVIFPFLGWLLSQIMMNISTLKICSDSVLFVCLWHVSIVSSDIVPWCQVVLRSACIRDRQRDWPHSELHRRTKAISRPP